ncbi:MAG: MBL fold metallo-hydrolase [Gammaproteobacteria bacterium]|jgi:glyoxylase-like metal-dependent hydrolase (beta-lactamase superfamily II)|nr:MBL fold metallo-hydrolase [Gammaproteobacteria bacterium]MBT4492025.1 MBL fold metallo-hydrolase [Gammaproteobacteria bacterium]MBT7369502.1 MBL fold metallo-hydrolase [Gammaproteobacteria bacterium]
MQSWQIGDVTITQLVELTFEGLDAFLPDATPEAVLPIDWLKPDFITPEGVLRFSIHALVIETPTKRIIVDTCVGNDKPRETFPDWHMLQTSFLDDLKSAGFTPESFDVVLCTHLHLDHVGWNTTLINGEWQPTFPNARYLIERTEFDYVHDEAEADDVEQWLKDSNRAVLADSITPVMAAGLVDLVTNQHQICEEVCLIPTPGHTIGHVSVSIESKGELALITGDFVHHPCQLAHPEWSVTTDYDPAQSVTTRETIFSDLADSPRLVIGTHWPVPTAGLVVREGNVYRLKY